MKITLVWSRKRPQTTGYSNLMRKWIKGEGLKLSDGVIG